VTSDQVIAAISGVVGLIVVAFTLVKTIREPLLCEIEKLRQHTADQYEKIAKLHIEVVDRLARVETIVDERCPKRKDT